MIDPPTIQSTGITKWDQLKRDVATAHSIDDLKEVRDKAEALRLYSKRQKESVDMQNKFAEITLRCERRAGEMLQEMPKNEGAKGIGSNQYEVRSLPTTAPHPPKLSDIGITKDQSSQWQAIARLPQETFEQHIEEVKAHHQELTTSGLVQVAKRNVDNIPISVPHISSKNNEWHTPWEYIDAARRLMGGIDLDPASNEYANQVVMATTYYYQEDSGLSHSWPGKVWLNPPYGRSEEGSNQDIWSRRLLEQYAAGITTEAVLLVNAAVDTKWFHRLFQYCEREPHFFPVCFPDHRINFTTPEPTASGSTHGSALVYLGTQIQQFYTIFSEFGLIFERMVYKW